MNLQEKLSADPCYQKLCHAYTLHNRRFLEIVLTLPKANQTAVFDFLDISEKMISRIMEVASEE